MKEYVLCCVSSAPFKADFLNKIDSLLATRVKEKVILSEKGLFAFDLHLTLSESDMELKQELMQIASTESLDMALIPHDGFRSKRKLIVFDMDSTLIQHEVIDEMARVHGIGEKVKLITERAMNGELNFDEALRERVSLLKGLRRSKMEEIFHELKLTSGIPVLMSELKKHGYKTAIVSGGFRYFAEGFKKKLGMDYAFANDLEFEGDVLSGKVSGKIVNASEKARLLEELATMNNLTLDQVVAVGDGANDLPMLAKAGFGIAYHAKEKVRKEARHQVSFGDMRTVLYFLGIPGNHLNETV